MFLLEYVWHIVLGDMLDFFQKHVWITRHATTLQSIMNSKLSKQRFWRCYETETIFMAVPKPLLTEFGFHYKLESCDAIKITQSPGLDTEHSNPL